MYRDACLCSLGDKLVGVAPAEPSPLIPLLCRFCLRCAAIPAAKLARRDTLIAPSPRAGAKDDDGGGAAAAGDQPQPLPMPLHRRRFTPFRAQNHYGIHLNSLKVTTTAPSIHLHIAFKRGWNNATEQHGFCHH